MGKLFYLGNYTVGQLYSTHTHTHTKFQCARLPHNYIFSEVSFTAIATNRLVQINFENN